MTQEPFGDIPLFREIQRLLSSSRGPINFEIARQVALALSTQGAAEPAPDPALRKAIADAVHVSEGFVSGYTRLPIEEPMRADVVTLAGWVRATLDGWRWILEHLATRLAAELSRLGTDGADQANAMQATLGQVGPLLSGMQVGTLVGQLSKDSLARHDIPIPRADDRRLLFVAPNLESTLADYGFERDEFVAWLSLHEVARHLVTTSVSWVERYFKSLLIEVVDAIEIDGSDLERRFVELSSMGMEALQEGARGANLLPLVPTERHRRAQERLRSFLSLLEGYASHAVDAVAPEMLTAKERIDEGMARARAVKTEGQALLEGVLGISVDRALEAAGATFCAAVAKLKGLAALNRVWDAPDNLPDAEEIRDPFTWIERQAL